MHSDHNNKLSDKGIPKDSFYSSKKGGKLIMEDIKNVRNLRNCKPSDFTNWDGKPFSESRKRILAYIKENGDIPESCYQALPSNHGNRSFGFIVKEDGIMITSNDYNNHQILMAMDEEHHVKIYTSEFNIALAMVAYEPNKVMFLEAPVIGKFFPFCVGGLTMSDFPDRIYKSINGQTHANNLSHEEIDINIYKDSVLVADLHGIKCSTLTFRRCKEFERAYMILVDVSEKDALVSDFTVPAENLVRGASIPILADALKPQSLLFDALGSPFYFHRELIFTKDADGSFTDSNIKAGISAIQDSLYYLELATIDGGTA